MSSFRAAVSLLFYFLICSAAFSEKNSNHRQFQLNEVQPGKIVFSLKTFDIKLESLTINDSTYQIVSVRNYGVTTRQGLPMLPQTAALLILPGNTSPNVTILESQFEEITGVNVAPVPISGPELPVQYYKDNSVYQSNAFWPKNLAASTGVERFRGKNIARIQVNPVQYNPLKKTLRIYRTLKIQVTFPGESSTVQTRRETNLLAKLNNSLFLNYGQFQSVSSESNLKKDSPKNDWYNPQYNYYKLFVDKEGIYSLNYSDLENAGMPLQSLELSRLKIFNQGEEIPIRIEGPQGATFDPGNIIYFYGDRNKGSDTYFDFYTDTNTYWLTDDGDAGSRYQLIAENPAPASLPAFYWENLHLEKDKLFHRSNGSSAIDEGEAWIWRYFFDDDQEVINFRSSGIFQSVGLCTLRLRLHGTTRDPVNPDHHVRISINNEVVSDLFFDEQTELLTEVTFPTRLLKEGSNQIKLHLVPDTGAQINQIYLDWVEVVYPRLHAATGSSLSFSDPAPSGGLREYSLLGFRDPEIRVFDPANGKIWRPNSSRQSIYRVESAGFDDGKYVKISTDFETMDFASRGHNLLVIHPQTGAVETKSFDTYASTAQADAMANYINSLADSTVVLAGIADDGTAGMTENAYQALESLGSSLTRQVQGRDSWALIGWKGAAAGTVKETISARFSGPAAVLDTLKDKLAIGFNTVFKDIPSAETIYLAVSNSGVEKVKSIEKDATSDLRSSAHGADYIVITHANFRNEAERLASYRNQKDGLRTTVIDVEDIYDEFNFGIMHPAAIKDFLSFAFLNWQTPAPSFVVLFGDASWDPKGLLFDSKKNNFVPSYGILVSDNWFVSLDGDDDILPDLFIGRIPVETPEQAAFVVDKIIAYENLSFASWDKKIVLLNGGINNTEQTIFRFQADALIAEQIDTVPLKGEVIRFDKNTNEAITQVFRRTVAEIINEGVLWVNFIGHSASSVWDIDIGRPDEWQNENIFPFVTGMSCHSSRFANPKINSLAEHFFVSPIGASAYWGSTGFGYISQDFFLLEGLLIAVNRDTVRSIGAATTFAKLHLWQRLGARERSRFVIEQYALIGDPAMNLRIPRKPELAITAAAIEVGKNLLLTSDSTTTISAKVYNYGLVPLDSVDVGFSVTGPDNSTEPLEEIRIQSIEIVDSVSVVWNIPQQPGSYRLQVEVDPENLIEEEDDFNNIAEKEVVVFASDLTLIKPLQFGVVTTSNPELLTNNSRVAAEEILYYFELDTTNRFNSPALQQSGSISAGELVTSWQPTLSKSGSYFWRVRTFYSQNFGPWAGSSFHYSPQSPFNWQQSTGEQFSQNNLNKTVSESSAVELQQNQIVYELQSAGFSDGNYVLLVRNNEVLGQIFRGHLIAVFDETDGNLLSIQSFDTWLDVLNAEAMAQFINNLPDGQIILAAIKDEGSRAMTENAYLALERIGSAMTRQVGSRDSWAIIGRKGAAIGSVPEALQKSGTGPAAVADTLFRFAKQGRMISTEIGPALEWRSSNFDFSSASPNDIEFAIFGRNKTSGQVDTLISAISGVQQVDISQIDVQVYPKLNLGMTLYSENGLVSPQLNSWSVDFVPPPDLVIGGTTFQLSQDTVLVGDEIELRFDVANFGLSASGSFDIRILAEESAANSTHLTVINSGSIGIDEIAKYESVIETDNLLGRVTLSVQADILDKIPEINETNNIFTTTFWVLRDTLGPKIRVTFDGREVGEGEFVSMSPQVIVEIRDRGRLSAADTSLVTMFLDGERIEYGSGPGQARFLPQQNPDDRELKALAIFAPLLDEGNHRIDVIAKDASGNVQSFETGFTVSAEFSVKDVMNYPNPFVDFTDFTYVLTQPAEQARIKIFTIAGRLIRQLEFAPTDVGFNRLAWDGLDSDGDPLSNGVYLYKIIVRKGDEQKEVLEKLVIMR